eukprot:gene2891-4926_t
MPPTLPCAHAQKCPRRPNRHRARRASIGAPPRTVWQRIRGWVAEAELAEVYQLIGTVEIDDGAAPSGARRIELKEQAARGPARSEALFSELCSLADILRERGGARRN